MKLYELMGYFPVVVGDNLLFIDTTNNSGNSLRIVGSKVLIR